MSMKMLWATISLMIVTMLIFVSCGPRAVAPAPAIPAPTPTTPTPAAPAPAPTPAPAPAASEEKPKYGGTINILRANITDGFDSAATFTGMSDASSGLVYEQLVYQDWSKGLAGTGEIDFGSGVTPFEGYGPQLAESWEIPESGTWILKIRRGVHFALNPASEASRLVNGRELTADDVVWNVFRYHNDPAFPNARVRRNATAMARAVTVEKTGTWEVILKTPVDSWIGFFWVVTGGNSQHFFAPEVIKKYGDARDWRNAVGTGAFMITDYIEGSVVTAIRNPSYWDKDSVGPGKGSQLPYVDTVKLLVVPDISTRLAAMRTSKADWVTEVELEDGEGLISTNPRLQYKRYLPAGLGIWMRIDKNDLPFKDKRVRQALMMATDFEALKNDLYRGKAEIQTWPVAPSYTRLWVPVEKMTESVKALYKYNPERAKQLLAEAGYPNGFKTKMFVQNVSAQIDPAAAFKAMWAKVGVEIELQPRDAAVYNALPQNAQEELQLRSTSSTSLTQLYTFYTYRAPYFGWSDPVVENAFQEMQKNMFLNMPKVEELYRKLMPHVMEQAYVIPHPTAYNYTFWQPWVKNHHGETALRSWLSHAWIDQNLKEQMAGRR